MKSLCFVVVVLATVAHAATARTPGGAVLAPVPSAALESFIESGAHTEAEIDAVAQAEVAAFLGDSEADADEHEEEAEAAVEAEAEVDAEMPRDTKAEEAREKRRARRAARAAAGKRPVPPPNGDAALRAAAGGDSDIVRLVYDELQRLGSMSTPAPGAAPASSLGVADPRIATLEHRLTTFENARAESQAKSKNAAISQLQTRLNGLDKTLAALRKASEEQQQLSQRLLKATRKAEAKQDAGNAVDYSVGYVKATLPKDFDSKVEAILKSVKTEARKIYERYCKRAGIAPKPDTPKSYPTEGAAPAAAGAAAAPAADAAEAPADAAAPAAAAAAAAGAPSMAPQPPAEARREKKAKNTAVKPSGKPEKLLFSPITIGKEPTPEGMRLSKALNDISLALPVTPAYALSSKEKALQDVLGESAVNPKWKTPRL